MAITFIDSVAAGSLDADTVTTGGMDTTGATLLVVAVASYNENPQPAVSDSKSNVWTGPVVSSGSSGAERIAFWHCIPTSVGSSHTFTASQATSFVSIVAAAFAGAAASTPLDQSNATSTTGNGVISTAQAGSVTPGQDNEVVIAAIASSVTSVSSIDSSFTLPAFVLFSSGLHWGCALAYKIQTSAGAENPTWQMAGIITTVSANIVTFKVAGGVAITPNVSALTIAGVASALRYQINMPDEL